MPAGAEAPGDPESDAAATGWPVRLSIAVALPVAGAGIMVGGIFEGAVGRIDAIVAGVFGVLLAAGLSRVRRATLVNLGALLGVFAVGLILVLPNGLDSAIHIKSLVQGSAKAHRTLRPPVPLDPGWQALIGWIMALVGVVVGWCAVVLRRSGFAFLLSLPVMVAAA